MKEASLPDRRGRSTLLPVLALGGLVLTADSVSGQNLRGSSAKLDRQNEVAQQHDFTYLRNPQQVRRFVDQGLLVAVRPNADFDLHSVSFPYARPEVALFIERLASQYRNACGEKLVVTSLTRPLSNQPGNASPRSVHPTGMALDLRIPANRRCRSWLEETLVQLDRNGVLDATRETRPPHYHVVVFPRQYVGYVDRLETRVAEATAPLRVDDNGASERLQYMVRRGDSLWTIAQRLGTTVEQIKTENDLRSNRIYAGQVIEVSVSR